MNNGSSIVIAATIIGFSILGGWIFSRREYVIQ